MKTTYLTGEVLSWDFIIDNLDTQGHDFSFDEIWDPRIGYGEEEAEEYFHDYLSEGLRKSYIFKDYSGYGFYKEHDDPVFTATESDHDTRYSILTKLWEDYPQCIDALVHIGHTYLENKYMYGNARNCYLTAVSIAEKNLPEDFDGILRWMSLENRPYLRALHGLCLVCWKMESFSEAQRIAEKLLRLCPEDNLGVRFIIDKIANQIPWSPET